MHQITQSKPQKFQLIQTSQCLAYDTKSPNLQRPGSLRHSRLIMCVSKQKASMLFPWKRTFKVFLLINHFHTQIVSSQRPNNLIHLRTTLIHKIQWLSTLQMISLWISHVPLKIWLRRILETKRRFFLLKVRRTCRTNPHNWRLVALTETWSQNRLQLIHQLINAECRLISLLMMNTL